MTRRTWQERYTDEQLKPVISASTGAEATQAAALIGMSAGSAKSLRENGSVRGMRLRRELGLPPPKPSRRRFQAPLEPAHRSPFWVEG